MTKYYENKSNKKYILYSLSDFHIRSLSLLFDDFNKSCLNKMFDIDDYEEFINFKKDKCDYDIGFMASYSLVFRLEGKNIRIYL